MTIPPSRAENGLVVIVVVGAVVVVVVGRWAADEMGPLMKMLVLNWPPDGGVDEEDGVDGMRTLLTWLAHLVWPRLLLLPVPPRLILVWLVALLLPLLH